MESLGVVLLLKRIFFVTKLCEELGMGKGAQQSTVMVIASRMARHTISNYTPHFLALSLCCDGHLIMCRV
jgi:hypothetical protein